MRGIISGAIALLLVVAASHAGAYDADLIPLRNRPEARDMSGRVSITGEAGVIRASVSGVNDAAGDPLDERSVMVELHLRVNGTRRRTLLAVPVSVGDGASETTLGLAAGARIVVRGVRLRGPTGKILAEAGAVTVAPAVTPPAPTPPPTLNECPAALTSCQTSLATCTDDLATCTDDLDTCESAN